MNNMMPQNSNGILNNRGDTEEYKRTEDLTKLTECFDNLGLDPVKNIKHLAGVCGDILKANLAFYNHLDAGLISSVVRWNAADSDRIILEETQKKLCENTINETDGLVLIRNLDRSKYAQIDPNINQYQLKTYIAYPVKANSVVIGALCFIFQHDFIPSNDEKRLISIIASAISVEEGRKQAMEALQRREKQFSSLVANIPGAVYRFVYNSGWEIEFISNAIEEISGYPAEDFINNSVRTFASIIHAEDRDSVTEIIEQALANKQPYEIKYRIVRVDGNIRWVHEKGQGIFDEKGNVVMLDGAIFDISDRQQTQAEIQQNQVFLDSIVENIPNMIFVKDAKDLKFVRWNKAGEELVGYSKEELIGKTDHDFFGAEEASFFTAKDREVLTGRNLVDIPEESIQTKHNGTRILHTKKIPILDRQGRPQYLLGISEDITDRQRAEKAIAESNRKINNILSSITDAFFALDYQGKFTYINQPAADLFQITPDRLIGSNIWQEFPHAIGSKFYHQCHQSLEQQIPITFEEFSLADSTWLEIQIYPSRDGLCIYLRNITNRKRSQEEQRKNEAVIRALYKVTSARKLNFKQRLQGLLALGRRWLGLEMGSLGKIVERSYEVIANQLPKPANLKFTAGDVWNLEQTFCSQTILSKEPVSFEAASGSSWCRHPAYQSSKLEAYIGTPVIVAGKIYGTLSFFSLKSRQEPFKPVDKELLKLMAQWIGGELERQQAEAALQASENKYRSVVNNVKEVIFQTDVLGLWTFLNPAWTEITGYTIEQSIGTNFFNYIHPSDRQQHGELFKPLINGEQEYCRQEIRYLTQDGKVRTLEVYARLNYADDGTIIGTSGTLNDITDRKQAEEAIRQSEELFRLLVEGVKDYSIIMLDPDGRIVSWNQGAQRLMQYSTEEIINQHFSCFYTQQDQSINKAEQNIQQAIAEGRMQYEHWQVRKDGSCFLANVVLTALFDDKGQLRGFSKVMRDITEQKQAEEALFESKARLQFAMNAARMEVWDLEITSQKMIWSEDVVSLAGIPLKAFDGTYESFLSYVHPEDREAVKQSVELSVQSGTKYHNEYRIIQPDGSYRWVESKADVLCDRLGKVLRLTGTIIDISDRKQAEIALFESQTRLKLLNTISTGIAVARSVNQVIKRAVKEISQYFPTLRVSYSTIDEQGNLTVIYSQEPPGMMPLIGLTTQFTDIPSYISSLRGNQPAIIEDITQIPQLRFIADAMLSTDTRAILDVPLQHSDRLVGLLGFSSSTPRHWSQHEIATLTEIAEYLSLALKEAYTQQKRRQALAELQKSEDRFRNLIETTSDWVWELDLNGIYTYVSPKVYDIIGYNPQEVLGKTPFEFMPPGEAFSVANIFGPIAAAHQPFSCLENTYIHKDGYLVVIETSGVPLFDADGKFSGYRGIDRDITERKRAEEILRQQALVFENLYDGIIITNLEGSIIDWNPSSERMFGYSKQEALGKNPGFLHKPEESTMFTQQILDQIIRDGRWTGEINFIRKEGTEGFCEAIYVPLCNEQDKIVACIGVTHDITKRKEAEAEIRIALEKEKELRELKSRFISMASHEFRTPLATILTASDLLKRFSHKLTEDKKLERLNKIQIEVKHMTQLLEDVLIIGKAEAGKIEFNPVFLDLEQLCRDILEEIEITAGKTHNLIFSCQGDFKNVYMDEKLLRPVLINLLSNAVKYSPKGGNVYFDLASEDNQAILKIKDEGIGIPQADREHLFEAFHRAANVGNISGTGLGLTIIKNALELHNGTIAVDSEVGIGTTFTVYVPMIQNKEDDR